MTSHPPPGPAGAQPKVPAWVLSVPCNSCNAAVGVACGLPAGEVHIARVLLAKADPAWPSDWKSYAPEAVPEAAPIINSRPDVGQAQGTEHPAPWRWEPDHRPAALLDKFGVEIARALPDRGRAFEGPQVFFASPVIRVMTELAPDMADLLRFVAQIEEELSLGDDGPTMARQASAMAIALLARIDAAR